MLNEDEGGVGEETGNPGGDAANLPPAKGHFLHLWKGWSLAGVLIVIAICLPRAFLSRN